MKRRFISAMERIRAALPEQRKRAIQPVALYRGPKIFFIGSFYCPALRSFISLLYREDGIMGDFMSDDGFPWIALWLLR